MRVIKKYDVRLAEILDAAEELFTKTGYESTTVNNILDKVGIGKGTFYHYFKSKDEVVNSVIDRVIQFIVSKADKAMEHQAENANKRMQNVLRSLNIDENLHKPFLLSLGNPSNALLHQRFTLESIRFIAPILAAVVKQGINEGLYTTDYPLETMEILTAANQIIFNGTIMHMSPEEQKTRGTAFLRVLESSLNAAKGSFDFLYN